MSDHAPPLPPEAMDDATDDGNRNVHMFLGVCVLGCLAFIAWATLGTLGIVSQATGEVVPSTQVKTVQHLEGGIIREIQVREGERVKKGQPLIVLESTASGADVIELKARITGLRIEAARLQAEAEGLKQPKFDASLVASSPDLIREALNLFNSRRNRLGEEIAGRTEIMTQRQHDVRESRGRIRNQGASLKLLNEQIKISEELIKDDLTNRYNHLNLLKDATKLKGAIEEDRVALERALSTFKQARSDRARVKSTYQQEVRTDLEQARRQLAEFAPRMTKFEDSLKRTVLRAPVDGVIKTLYVVTIGGVLRAGDTVVDIVPVDDRLVIEAKLPTQDIGFVQQGQRALVKLASTDAMRFDSLEGKVVSVSPDTLIAQDGVPFYKVRIETDRDHFARGNIRYNLFPGMQVSASIHTGERTVLEYIFDPFLDSMGSAMRER